MKKRRFTAELAIVAVAVLIGTAWKWGRGDFTRQATVASVTNGSDATSVDSVPDARQPTDPLVAPIHVSGYMPAWKLADQPPEQAGVESFILAADEFAHDIGATFHAHGKKICASGCATSNHPTKTLTREYFFELLDRCAVEPMSENSSALESLLYFGRQTRKFIEEEGFGPLDAERARFLWSELSRTHARISIRVVDEHGEIRSWLDSTQVPLDRRHVFDMQVRRVQPLITSGTVKRVGLHHLWTRL